MTIDIANIFDNLAVMPADPLFQVKQNYTQDTRAYKADLGIGAYRDNNGKPWILPSVVEAEKLIQKDPSYNHEYLGMSGLPALTSSAAKVIFGEDFPVEERVASIQSLSGTGALHLAAKLLSWNNPTKSKKIYLSDPTWGNHNQLFGTCGFELATYKYWDAENKAFNFQGMMGSIANAPAGSIFVLHACAHNPTGIDPSKEQWVEILQALKQGEHLVIFDSAYQGFASGSLEEDSFAIRLAINDILKDFPILVCQSFAKNVGMYGERVGCFHVVLGASNTKAKKAVSSQLATIMRSEVSMPPAYGAKIVATILTTPELKKQWFADLVTMSSRIIKMRHALKDKLEELNTPGTWDHIVNQNGMFSYTGLTKDMVARLAAEHAVYLAPSGRASVAGVNEGNVEHVAKSINEVVNFYQSKL